MAATSGWRPRSWLLTAVWAVLLAGSGSPAYANLIELGNSYHDAVFVGGSDQSVTEFRAVGAGTVTITLADIGWTEMMQSMSTSVSSGGSLIESFNGPGSLLFAVDAQQLFATSIFAVARASNNMGLYTLDVQFAPAVQAVPLPAAAWLLVSGLAGLGFLGRRQKAVTVPQ